MKSLHLLLLTLAVGLFGNAPLIAEQLPTLTGVLKFGREWRAGVSFGGVPTWVVVDELISAFKVVAIDSESITLLERGSEKKHVVYLPTAHVKDGPVVSVSANRRSDADEGRVQPFSRGWINSKENPMVHR